MGHRLIFTRLRDAALELVLPTAAACLLCGDPRRAQASDCLCPACREMLEKQRLQGALCLRCMTPLDDHGHCAFCAAKGLGRMHEGFAAFRHQGAARQLVTRLKFQYCDAAALPLVQGMAQSVPLGRYDTLVPVPLHPRRQRVRGANQAEILCRGLSPKLGIPVLSALRRVQYTREQSSLPRAQRLQNVQNAFSLQADVRGLRLLLVDDVRTTGATSRACAQTLLRGGAQSVGILTATIAVKEGKPRER